MTNTQSNLPATASNQPTASARKRGMRQFAIGMVGELRLDYFPGFSRAAEKALLDYPWPGNVRELRHALHRGFIMAESSKNVIQLPAELASPFSRSVQHKDKGITVGKTVEDVERELIETTLNHLGGDKKKAADMLGISLKTLYNRLNSYSP